MPTPHRPGNVAVNNFTVYCQIVAALRPGHLSAQQISISIGRARRYADGFLWTMRAAGLISGHRGPKGGYTLTDKGKRTDVLGLVEAIHGEQTNALIKAWRGMSPDNVACQVEMREAADERARHHRAAGHASFGMIEYGPGDFERMHAAGSMLASASGVPALFNLIPSRFGKLAYGMHLTGERPLPDISKETYIRLGHLLEPFVATLLSEELGAEVTKLNGYARHDFLPLFSTPDGVVTINGVETMVEIKSVGSKAFYEDWQHGPPVHVGLQHQVQFATTGAEAGIIAVFDRNYCRLEWYPTTPHQPTIEKVALNVHTFMSALDRGEYPAPDDGEADFEAFRQIMWQSDPKKTIGIAGDEAERRAQQFMQAKLDEAAASKTIEAHKRWFQRIMGDAQIANVSGATVEWKTNKSKTKSQHRPARVFKIKELNGEDDG